MAWVALYLIIALRLRTLRCPRCGKNLFETLSALLGSYVGPTSLFRKECATCDNSKKLIKVPMEESIIPSIRSSF